MFDVPSTKLNNRYLKQLKPRTNANNQVFPLVYVAWAFTWCLQTNVKNCAARFWQSWYRALDKLAKLCDEELDGQHSNIGRGSGQDIDPLHWQGVIALWTRSMPEPKAAIILWASRAWAACRCATHNIGGHRTSERLVAYWRRSTADYYDCRCTVACSSSFTIAIVHTANLLQMYHCSTFDSQAPAGRKASAHEVLSATSKP